MATRFAPVPCFVPKPPPLQGGGLRLLSIPVGRTGGAALAFLASCARNLKPGPVPYTPTLLGHQNMAFAAVRSGSIEVCIFGDGSVVVADTAAQTALPVSFALSHHAFPSKADGTIDPHVAISQCADRLLAEAEGWMAACKGRTCEWGAGDIAPTVFSHAPVWTDIAYAGGRPMVRTSNPTDPLAAPILGLITTFVRAHNLHLDTLSLRAGLINPRGRWTLPPRLSASFGIRNLANTAAEKQWNAISSAFLAEALATKALPARMFCDWDWVFADHHNPNSTTWRRTSFVMLACGAGNRFCEDHTHVVGAGTVHAALAMAAAARRAAPQTMDRLRAA